jgi:hypothetical protein
VATVHVSLPSSAASGSTVTVTTTLVVGSDAARVILQPSTSGLAVLRGTTVVAWEGGRGTTEVPMPLVGGTTRSAQVVPGTLRLAGCDGAALPPGRYTVQAVVGYGGDPLNGAAGGTAGTFQLVSAPVPLTVN